MFERFTRSWELAKASASVIQADKELLLFPVMSGIVTMVLLATFILPIYMLKLFSNGNEVMGGILAFAFYFCSYSVTFFFNSALVAAALIRLNGGDPTVSDGLNAAKARIVPILGYAAIAATVGMILNGLRNKDNNLLVRMIGAGLGVAWTLSTFLVVPVLVNENVGPIDAIKESVKLLKRTWGENAIGNVGIGMVFGVIFLCAILVGVVLVVRGPSGETVSCNANASYGDLARLGTWTCPLNVPANSGTWTVVSITATDGAGNAATYTPRQIDVVRDAFEYTWLTYEFFP